MKVGVFQHVSFEGTGSIRQWLDDRSHEVVVIRFYEQDALPGTEDIDTLIVMGGPMGVNDEHLHPWLRDEKRFIERMVAGGKTVLGICLGAQLVAASLGARVFPSGLREIGWFPVWKPASAAGALASLLPQRMDVFQWHGDTFDLPRGAARIAQGAACENQAFAIGNRVLGLQFHLEATPASVRALAENCRGQIVPSPTIQTEGEMLAVPGRFNAINRVMAGILDSLLGG